VHQKVGRTKISTSVVHEPHELPQIGLSYEIDHASQFRMVLMGKTNLHERNLTLKLIDNSLVSHRVPPHGAPLIGTTRRHDPKRMRHTHLFDLRDPASLDVTQDDIPALLTDWNHGIKA